jgi:hypothetical protein
VQKVKKQESTTNVGKRVSPWVVAFVIYHIAVTFLGALPKPNQQVLDGTAVGKGGDWLLAYNHNHVKNFPLVYGYLDTTGFWQYWDMFAPDPSQVDFWGDAEVIYADGTMVVYKYPRVYEAGYVEKYFIERYRKFFERVHPEQYSFIWPYFAQRVALLNADDPKNPPVKLFLRRHFQDLQGTHKIPEKPLPEYQMFRYFEYSVDQIALHQAKGWKMPKEWTRPVGGIQK